MKPFLLLLIVLSVTDALINNAESEATGDIINNNHEIREIRREIEQLRNEVRRCDETHESENNKIVLDWLTETVRDIKNDLSEVVQNSLKRESQFVTKSDFESSHREIKNFENQLLQIRVEEEKHFSKLEEVDFDLKHLPKEPVTSSKTLSVHKINKNHLSKKHLISWMETAEENFLLLFTKLSNIENELIALKKKSISGD